ncbi:protein CHROMATIN REMODELING 19 isoform X2 [Rhodamnia argentea]|uniref:Protein CHROMATIN REMODELING 19 isoform X2 n=1 Tax=Rhodamnia argentea TaxID=178133 RepID=A0ABM3HIQ6_9MYRT|nr:protein CHROMATIN REMODELING 19 isoform X2 [Rhodamnia argentea]
MKRAFDELTEGDWGGLSSSFKPSRVLRRPPTPPPPIESFAFRGKSRDPRSPSSSGRGVGDRVEISSSDNLDDDDVELVDSVSPPVASRGRRFIVDDDDDEEEEEAGMGSKVESDGDLVDVYDISSAEDEKEEEVGVEELGEEEDVVEDDDVVGKALQKCAKISSDLKKALYGSSVASCEHYSEVEASSNRIVTQDDVDAACGADDTDFQPVLKPYQLVGVNFLLLLHRKGVGGAILADEMGLGKTIQAITYLTLLKHLNNDPGPHLIVCPASLLENWERELKRWCPSFSVFQYHGANRSIYSKELTSLSKAGLPPPFNVLLVCYSLFERHSVQQKDDRKIFRRWRWSCVLMDEAHALKDKNSYRWKNLMSVARNANQRLMLTGTPLQNDLHVEFVTMDQQQEAAYIEAIEEYRAASGARLAKFSGDCLSNMNKVLPKRQISNYFFQFRKIANHPLLVRRLYDDGDISRFGKKLYQKGAFGFECGLERAIDEMKKYSDFSIHQLLLCYGIDGILSEEHAMLSAKCRALTELLPALHRDGHRVLIFSQWTSVLDILEWILEIIDVTYRRLDGSTQVTDRQSIVDTFNNDTSIFACLLSTRAGGQGLNLTGADTVVIHDMDFNPQIDRQAEDRCHRIGQTKPVTIYRLVTKGTVDENVYEIAKRKLVLDAAVLESGLRVDTEKDTAEKTMGEILSALLLP